MRTLTISRNNLWLRFYLWAWEANQDKLNVCKLFWGTVFLPIGVFFVKKNKRPFYCLSPLATLWLTCLVIPSLYLKEYAGALMVFMLVLCSMLYNHVRRDAISRKCSRQEAEDKAKKEELAAKDYQFSERTERILIKVLSPLFWLISLTAEVFEKVSWTKPGGRIIGFFSLCYHFIKSTKQKTCLFVRVE